MKLLVVVPRAYTGDSVNYKYLFPLGLAYISAVLKQAKHDVDCFNANHYAGTIDNLLGRLLAQNKYDYVLTGGLSTSYHQIKMITDAVHKNEQGAGLILGGGLISSEPELMFDNLNPDYIVIGEGERTIGELLERLAHKDDLSQVAGIGYRDIQGKFRCNKPAAAVEDLDSIPYPDFDGFEFAQYLDHMQPTDQYFYDLFDRPRVYPIVCSRSCPFLCTFCFHPAGNKYRQRSVDSIMSELAIMIKRYRINTIAIYDELFSNNRAWLYDFCRRFKEFTAGLSWECRWSCQMRVDKMDEEMLNTMKDAGCYMVSYGFESYSPVVLKSMKKHITPQQIARAVEGTLKNNISIQGNFIFGDPAETAKTATETLSFWKKHNYAGIMLGFINPYPGSDIYQQCLKRGVIKDKLDFIANHIFDVFNMSETMTEKEFEKLKIDIFEAELKYKICAVPNSVNLQKDGTSNMSVRCPHCQEVIEYKNYPRAFRFYYYYMAYCRVCRRRFFIVSKLYKSVSTIIVLLFAVSPYQIKKLLHNLLQKSIKIKPLIKKYILKKA